VKGWAGLLYGVAVGMAIAWVMAASLFGGPRSRWFAIGAATALATALFIHQRAASMERGRRWKKTRP